MTIISLSGGRQLDFSYPLVMGIINCTPDSFAVRYETFDKAIDAAKQMIDEGAAILDVGGESSRPGSDPVTAETEFARVIPVIEKIRSFSAIPISIDTVKAEVAEKALTAGADIINDISALTFDNRMASVAVKYNCPVILMHIKGKPKTMQDNPRYDNVIAEVSDYFTERIDFAVGQGIKRENIILDIGIGFGKRLEDNLTLLRHLQHFKKFNRPLLVGVSRKRFIGDLTGQPPENRLSGSLAAAAAAILNGANIVRTHDVALTKQAIATAAALREE